MLTVTSLLAFGLSSSNEAALRHFSRAVNGWQFNPEFRKASNEYCTIGSAATRTRFLFIPVGRLVMAARSMPFLPKRFAVNPTSKKHYDDFRRGPLSAYLHLCGEQSVSDVAGVLEQSAPSGVLSVQESRTFLDSFRMDFPVVKDLGALQSASSLSADVNPSRPLVIRTGIAPLLKQPIESIARELGFPKQTREMTPAEQQAVLDRLDNYIRHQNPELWRTKQISDFAGGIWAQVFGPPYNDLIAPLLFVHHAAQVALPVFLGILLVKRARRSAISLKDMIEDA